MKEQKFRKLEVWKKSIEFVEAVYKQSNRFPSTELYGLTSQIRRAALSIALNIAEGTGADSNPEFKRFLTIAIRSSYEVMCGIKVSHRLNYCNEAESNDLLGKCDELAAMLTGFTKKLTAEN